MNYTDMRINEAVDQLENKPLLSASAERILILDNIKSKYNSLPQPLRFASTLCELLSRVSTPISAHDLIAGRIVDRELSEEEEQIFQKFRKHPDYTPKMTFLHSGHCTYSWEAIIEYGITGLKKRVQNTLSCAENEDEKIFLKAMLMIYDGISSYMLRYAEKAKEMGMPDLADTLIRGATEKPTDFRTALQLLWIIAFINCSYISLNPTLTLGRLDQMLYPLYASEISAGTLTPEFAKELITDYYCKNNLNMGRGEHQVGNEKNTTTFDRICNFDAPQYLLLAGTDACGRDAVNELTLLFTECIRPEFKNPVIVVRYFKDMDTAHPILWNTLMQKALQSSSMMFYNDDNIKRTYLSYGIPEKDIVNYGHFGCNWPTLGASSAWIQGGPKSVRYNAYTSHDEEKKINIPFMRMTAQFGFTEDFMDIFKELAASQNEGNNVSIDDFYQRFFSRVTDFTKRKIAHCADEIKVRQRRPSALLTFGDCFYDSSIDTGKCFSANSKYFFELQAFGMFGTVADCFITVDKLVFVDKKLTLTELYTAVSANYQGYPAILAECRNVPKYGSDDPHANMHVNRIAKGYSDIVIDLSRPYLKEMGVFLTPCLQSDTWHLKKGLLFGATPNGRLANTPFSQNARPSNGSCVNGLTAMFNSMLNIPKNGFLSGALNLDVDKNQFSGENGTAIFGAILASYFNRGGLHAQVSCTSEQELIDAQNNPDRHRDLRVRVTGYSGIFVDICKKLQDDIIDRFK